MTLPEFLRRIKTADTDEIIELFKKYPDLAQQCADQIKEELDEYTAGRAVTYDGADYQRLVDRGEEDVVEYNYAEDVKKNRRCILHRFY